MAKPLSHKQRLRLRSMIKDVLADESGGGSPARDYTSAILNRKSRHAGTAGQLPPAARTFARIALATVIGRGDSATAMDAARTLDVEDAYRKSLTAGSLEDGGALLADDQAREVIELLRPVSVVRQMAGVRNIEIPRGTKRTPRIDVGVSSGYVAEGEVIPATGLKSGAVVLTAKKLATLVVLTNELSRFSLEADVDSIVLEDMLASIGQTEDTKFLFGTGAEAEPLGITKQIDDGNTFNADPTNSVQTVVDDLRQAMSTLTGSDVPMRNPTWLWSPRTSNFLMTLLNANGQFVFRSEIEQGKLFRWPFLETNNIPNNLGAGEDESLILLVDASEVMLGDVAQVGVDRSDAATVTIDGQPVNLFETDRSAIRVRTWNDIRLRHDVSAAVVEQVTFGA